MISALLTPDGTARRTLDQLAADGSTLLFSNAAFAELAVRLSKPKFDPYRTAERMDSFLDWLAELAEWVEPAFQVEACRDKDDNKLAVALAGEVTLQLLQESVRNLVICRKAGKRSVCVHARTD